jgi:hypothetical protein
MAFCRRQELEGESQRRRTDDDSNDTSNDHDDCHNNSNTRYNSRSHETCTRTHAHRRHEAARTASVRTRETTASTIAPPLTACCARESVSFISWGGGGAGAGAGRACRRPHSQPAAHTTHATRMHTVFRLARGGLTHPPTHPPKVTQLRVSVRPPLAQPVRTRAHFAHSLTHSPSARERPGSRSALVRRASRRRRSPVRTRRPPAWRSTRSRAAWGRRTRRRTTARGSRSRRAPRCRRPPAPGRPRTCTVNSIVIVIVMPGRASDCQDARSIDDQGSCVLLARALAGCCGHLWAAAATAGAACRSFRPAIRPCVRRIQQQQQLQLLLLLPQLPPRHTTVRPSHSTTPSR